MSHAHTAPHNRSVAIALLAVAALSACRQCEELEEEAQDVEPHHSRGRVPRLPCPRRRGRRSAACALWLAVLTSMAGCADRPCPAVLEAGPRR